MKPDKNNGYLTWRPTFIIVPRLILLMMRNVSDKVVEKLETFSKNCAIYETTWKNVV